MNSEIDSSIFLSRIFRSYSISANDTQLKLIENYRRLLIESNKKINLISRKDEDNFVARHVLGSVSLLSRFSLAEHSTVLDLGTGGGLPGIPLAILLPTVQFTLIDSIHKKINAVEEILGKLQLSNVSAACGRAEELSMAPGYKKSFDYVIARAVGPLKQLIGWGAPFLKETASKNSMTGSPAERKETIPRRSLILLKGGDLESEIHAATVACRPHSLSVYPLPSLDVDDLVDKKVIIIEP